MKKSANAFGSQFERLKERVAWRADQLGFDLENISVVEHLLMIGNGETDSEGTANEAWEAASWQDRFFAIAFRCSIENINADASEKELIDALCFGNWAIGFVDGLPGDKTDPSVCASCLIKQHTSEIGKTGALKRHAPMVALRSWAIEKFREGDWKSANQAAHSLKESVILHGRTIGACLSEENAQRTIAEWFRKSV